MRLDPELLATQPSLAALSYADRDGLARYFIGRGYAPNELIFEEGDPATSMLLVAQGTVIATSKASGTRELGRFGPGRVIGDAALLDHAPRPVTLRANTAVLIFELPQEALPSLRAALPTAAHALLITSLRSLLRRLRALEEKVEAEVARESVLW